MPIAADAVVPAATAAGGSPSSAAVAPEKAKAPVRITGRVLDETGRPVKGAAVSFVDSAGTQLLRDLIRRGIAIAACSAFVAELLHECNLGGKP